MAAASSSSSSAIIPLEKHDVFLSFRGEDTRNGFTSHLYDALDRTKIQTYIDYKLERGDQIAPALVEAITESKLSVIIFSKNYASSRWCLDELVHILKCRESQFVIPIFYDVDPSHVRKQSGSYADAFVEHEKRFKDSELKAWREALTTAGSISGFDSNSKEISSEAELVKLVVNDVLAKLNRKWQIESGLKGKVGIEKHVQKVESLLCLDSHDVQTVGIWGMGGIGKTTIADVVFHHLSSKFQAYHFIANVREASETRQGLHELRDQMLRTLLKEENLRVDTPSIGPTFVGQRLSCTKALVVLDDVSDLNQVEFLVGDEAGDHILFGPGSRIIVTSRNKRVLGVDNVKIYEVEELDREEALDLFHLRALRNLSPTSDYASLSREVVDHAGGNPLALTVLGSLFFHCKTKEDWKGELDKLKKYPNKEIQYVLRHSYDGLGKNEEDIFLDIACFHKGKYVDEAKGILEACGFSANAGVRLLTDMSLLSVDKYSCLQMHDLIQEMGRKIVLDECDKNPGKRSRLWLADDVARVLKKNTGTEAIECISMNMHDLSTDLCVNAASFQKMDSLRLLDIHSHSYSPRAVNKVHLPPGFEFLTDALKYIRWDFYPLPSLPSRFSSEDLVELHMPKSRLVQLWNKDVQIALGSLKRIHLSNSRHLAELPDLSGSPNLESIYLQECSSLVQLPSSIQHHAKLIHLDLRNCSSLKILPQMPGNLEVLDLQGTAIEELPSSIWSLEKLEELDISYCKELKYLPSSSCRLNSLLYLYVDGCVSLKSLPVELPIGLKTLDLDNCKSLESLPIELPAGLETLKLESCVSLKSLPIELPAGLETLDLKNCVSLKSLPIELPVGLKTLNLQGCESLESLPIELPARLEVLYLKNCKSLESLPIELPAGLETLDLENCQSLESLPIELPAGLKSLVLKGCVSLKSLPIELPSGLKKLYLQSCESLKSLPIELPAGLKALELYNCVNLESLPIELPAGLETLDLENCVSLKSLPVELPVGLKTLYLQYCKSLESLPIELPAGLEVLFLQNCKSLESLPIELPAGLEILNLENCESLESLPIELPAGLETLVLKGCVSLKSLPVELPVELKTLYLQYCKSLESLPIELPAGLEVLYLENCKSLESLPIELPAGLETLDLENCESLESLPIELHVGLKSLVLKGCVSLKSLPIELPSGLEVLDLENCESLKSLPIELPAGLEVLDLENCKSLESLPVELPSGLKKLNLQSCKSLKSLPIELPYGLKKLNLQSCKSLESLPIKLPSRLKKLNLQSCESLKSLPIELPAGLETLDLENCESLESLPIELPAGLKSLVLTGCKKLVSLPKLPWHLKQLLANGCTSLETVSSSMSIAPRWDEYVNSFKEDYPFEERIDFGNCLKLDQTARSNIMADAQLRTLRLATASCRPNDPCSISIEVLCPGNEIPKWLLYKSEGCSINIKLPPHWSRQGFLGYALCIVLEVNNVTLPDVLSRRSLTSFYNYLCCQTHHKINNSQLDFLETVTVDCSYKNYELLNSDHVFTWYFCPEYLESESAISSEDWVKASEASFDFMLYDFDMDSGEHYPSDLSTVRLKRCGVSLFYSQDIENYDDEVMEVRDDATSLIQMCSANPQDRPSMSSCSSDVEW